MSDIAQVIGRRIRTYRRHLGLTQEGLAERSGLHNTYIGQLERGEKNASLESIEKIARALEVPLSQLFEKIDNCNNEEMNYPLQIYEISEQLSRKEQEAVINLLQTVIALKRD